MTTFPIDAGMMVIPTNLMPTASSLAYYAPDGRLVYAGHLTLWIGVFFARLFSS